MEAFLAYGLAQQDHLIEAFGQHLVLVFVALLFSVMLAVLITTALQLAIHKNLRVGDRATEYVQGFLSAIYAVPSLALFALCVPLLGIGSTTAVIVLIAYNQFFLVRNFTAGLKGIDEGLIQASRSLGMTRLQTFTHIQLPLALPTFIAGVRLAAISTIAIATIASLIDAGGLGTIIFSGLRTNNLDQLLWATLLATILAVTTNAVLTLIGKIFAYPKAT